MSERVSEGLKCTTTPRNRHPLTVNTLRPRFNFSRIWAENDTSNKPTKTNCTRELLCGFILSQQSTTWKEYGRTKCKYIYSREKNLSNYSTVMATFTRFLVYFTANKRRLVSASITLMTVNAESNYSRKFATFPLYI